MTPASGIWWLASYPKSGNTWLRAFLSSLISGKAVDINDMNEVAGGIASSRSIVDDLLGIETADLTDDQQSNLRPRAYEVLAAESNRPTYLKVHDQYGTVPSGEPLFPSSVTHGAVYIVRNPLDVAVSLSHYAGISMNAATNLLMRPDACGAAKQGCLNDQLKQNVGDWASHMDSWLAAPFPVHLVRYEDMLATPHATFGAIVQFLGRTESREAVALAVRDSSFDRLRGQEQTAGFRANSKSGNYFFRRGIAGSWRDELPSAEADRILDAFDTPMRRLGYRDSDDDWHRYAPPLVSTSNFILENI